MAAARDLDRFVETRMVQVMAGDDEALNILILELRPLALDLIPAYVMQGHVPVDVITQQAVVALYQALMLWSPVRGPFLPLLQRRVKESLQGLFLRVMDMTDRVEVTL